jgi:hypothetical protein
MKDYEPKIFKEFGLTVIDECFPSTQHIITDNGPIPIGKIYELWKKNKTIPRVKSFNTNTKTFEFKDITYAWEKENSKPIIHIKAGRNIYKSTPNHKYLTHNGWKEARQLTCKDRLICNLDYNIKKNYFKVLNSD